MKSDSNDGKVVIKNALLAAKKMIKKNGGRKNVKKFRSLPLPLRTGGTLRLIPIFASLSALGALTNGIAGITQAINKAKSAKQQADEANRHNRVMENVAMGGGLYLRPYKVCSAISVKLFNENFKNNSDKKKKIQKFKSTKSSTQ